MKTFLVTIALFVLFSIFSVYQIDSDTYGFQNERLKSVAEDAANAAGLCLDAESFSHGYIRFDEDKGREAARLIVEKGIPVTGYWRGSIAIEVYFYNANTDGTFSPKYYTDTDTNYTQSIRKPSVIVKLKTGKPRLRMNIFNDITNSIRIACYEYDERYFINKS